MKIVTVIGARPQFIKASVVSNELKKAGVDEIVIHTGQHFDHNMSKIFFDQLRMSHPKYQFDINGGFHGQMTGRMLEQTELVMINEKPDLVLVYGDTNSTLAGALAAAKLHIPVVHIEAGLRSFDKRMPEEINRILTDNVSDYLFCPTEVACKNLFNEGFRDRGVKIFKVGDVMQDSALYFAQFSKRPQNINLKPKYVLATLHRAENTDSPERLKSIVNALNKIHQNLNQVVLPLHPRTKNSLFKAGLNLNVTTIDPVGYLEMIWLIKNSSLVITDSGGLQKEAFFFNKFCLTMRDTTEWVELIEANANILVGPDEDRIFYEAKQNIGKSVQDKNQIYGGGSASIEIVKKLLENI